MEGGSQAGGYIASPGLNSTTSYQKAIGTDAPKTNDPSTRPLYLPTVRTRSLFTVAANSCCCSCDS